MLRARVQQGTLCTIDSFIIEGRLRESDPAGVICTVMDGIPDRILSALLGAAQMQADGIPSFCYVVKVQHQPP